MPRTRLQPSALPDPVRYSHGFRVGNTVYLAGALGTEADGSMPPDIRTQTRRAFEKLATVMQEAGGKLTDIVKLTVFITDMWWREGFFKQAKSARSSFHLILQQARWCKSSHSPIRTR
jgi:enamine deaminase RidA (YjgF/YER057c/UK114 family)